VRHVDARRQRADQLGEIRAPAKRFQVGVTLPEVG